MSVDAPRSLPNASTLRATVERSRGTIPGFIGLIILVLVVGAAIGVLGLGVVGGNPILIGVGLVMGVLGLLTFNGMFILEPNEAAVLTLFGTYKGTVKSTGWHLVNPLIKKRQLSVRANNFNSDKLKVNDADGNPVEIAAVVVWRVFDAARATFDVENYKQFVQVQTETAIRHLATKYPYDQRGKPDEPTLRGNPDEVAGDLQIELQTRLKLAGIEVLETRVSHLAYSPEIAAAMLQRQQAAAIIAARQRIVTGAVGIVESVLKSLHAKRIVSLSQEQKAGLVSNLLVVIASEKGAQPILQVQ